MIKKLLIPFICITLLCGCTATKKSGGKEKLNIVTTIFPLYDFARAICGENADIKLLIKAGCEVHSFDPSPSDAASIYDCDLFLYTGGESDVWAKRMIAEVNVNPVPLMDSVPLLSEDGKDEYDEHIWTSPSNACLMIKEICKQICLLDENNSGIYKTNAQKYCKEITDISLQIGKTVQSANEKFILVADRFPFKYFANEFDIEYEAAFDGCTASTDISLKTLDRLIKTVEERNCKAAFYIEMSDKNIARALSDKTGVKLYELHSAHNVTKDDFDAGVTYADILKRNLNVLKEALK